MTSEKSNFLLLDPNKIKVKIDKYSQNFLKFLILTEWENYS